VDLSPRGYRTFLRACCRKAAADEVPLTDILGGIVDGSYGAAVTGEGIYDISSTSNAGQSVTQNTGTSAPGKSDVGDAAELLLEIAERLIAEEPLLEDDSAALCAAMRAELPLRDVRRKRSSFVEMTPDV
jgi:hypothetical protein